MNYSDTGLCVSETAATLAYQQAQLVAGRRDVQMFPTGTPELPLPDGAKRFVNARGAFHFRPDAITARRIDDLSHEGRENEFLMLGPISKSEVARRVLVGEALRCITEYTPDGVEVRSAAGTHKTANEQREYFESTKEPDNRVTVGSMQDVIDARLAELS